MKYVIVILIIVIILGGIIFGCFMEGRIIANIIDYITNSYADAKVRAFKKHFNGKTTPTFDEEDYLRWKAQQQKKD